ncbi:hypothetical protein BpHYR1_017767, partial [Brachionus plicatilis]
MDQMLKSHQCFHLNKEGFRQYFNVKKPQFWGGTVKLVKRAKILFLVLNFLAIIYNYRGSRVNPFDPFEPPIFNREAKGIIQKFRENWVTIFEVFEQNGFEIINKKNMVTRNLISKKNILMNKQLT